MATSLCGHRQGVPEKSVSSATLLCSVNGQKLLREKDDLDVNADLDPEELTTVSHFLKGDMGWASLSAPTEF